MAISFSGLLPIPPVYIPVHLLQPVHSQCESIHIPCAAAATTAIIAAKQANDEHNKHNWSLLDRRREVELGQS
jgi:hypothetical protein